MFLIICYFYVNMTYDSNYRNIIRDELKIDNEQSNTFTYIFLFIIIILFILPMIGDLNRIYYDTNIIVFVGFIIIALLMSLFPGKFGMMLWLSLIIIIIIIIVSSLFKFKSYNY